MPIRPGDLLAHHHVVSSPRAEGRGEVWRATDTEGVFRIAELE